MSNCHRSRTSLLSMLEMTTTRRCTMHLYSHSARSHGSHLERENSGRDTAGKALPPARTFHLLRHVVEVVGQLGSVVTSRVSPYFCTRVKVSGG